LANFQAQKLEIDTQLVESKARLEEIKKQLEEQAKTVVSSQTITANPVVQQLQSKLTDLQIQLPALKEKYSEKSPQVTEVEIQIKQIENEISQKVAEIVGSTVSTVNPIYQNLLSQMVTLETNMISLETKSNSISEIVTQYENRLEELPEKEIQLARLERSVRVAENIYITLLESYQEARISEAMELGDTDLGDDLLEWAKKAFREIAARRSINLAGPFRADKIDPSSAKTGEGRKAAEEARDIMKQRAVLAEQAQRLGMIEVSDALIHGKVINSNCPWDVLLTASYIGSLEGTKESWVNKVDFQGVPANASAASYENSASGQFTKSEFSYFDGAEWISGQPEGEVTWDLDFSPSGEKDVISLDVSCTAYHQDVYVQYQQGSIAESGPIGGLALFEEVPSLMVPLENLQKRESFSLEKDLEFKDGRGKIEVKFTP